MYSSDICYVLIVDILMIGLIRPWTGLARGGRLWGGGGGERGWGWGGGIREGVGGRGGGGGCNLVTFRHTVRLYFYFNKVFLMAEFLLNFPRIFVIERSLKIASFNHGRCDLIL